MVNASYICGARAKIGSNVSFHRLALSRKKLLECWINCLQLDTRKSPINKNTRIRSKYLQGRGLRRKGKKGKFTKTDSIDPTLAFYILFSIAQKSIKEMCGQIKEGKKDEKDATIDQDSSCRCYCRRVETE